MNITNATITNVITAFINSPNRKGPTAIFYQVTPGGVAYCIIGIIRSDTIAWINSPRYIARIKATAIPRTLYVDRNALNSLIRPLGGGGIGAGGFGVSSSVIFFNSSKI